MKVSLVLVSKNEENNVKSFFNSLKKQTMKPDEIILVDSSVDKTAKLARPFVDKLIKSPPKTAGYARSIGIKKSKGDIVVFTDLDAILHPDWLENLVKPFKNLNINVVQGQVFYYSYNGKGERGLFQAGLKEWNVYLNHCNTAYRKKVLEEIPFDPEQLWDDVEMSYRVSKKYLIYGCKKAKVYHYGIDIKDRNLWKCALWNGTGWIRIMRKYKNFYWLMRMFYNHLNTLKVRGPRVFIYYSIGFLYAFYFEITNTSPSHFEKR